MTSGKSACYTRQKMLPPPPPLYANERTDGRTDGRTNANGRQFLYVYLDATVNEERASEGASGRKGRKGLGVPSFLPSFALSTVFRAS